LADRIAVIGLAVGILGVVPTYLAFISSDGDGPPPTTSRPLPEVQTTVAPEFSSTWLFPSAPTALGKPPAAECSENKYRLWLQRSGAIPTFNSFSVTLRANTDATVIVEGMSIRVLKREPRLAGILLDCPIGGPGGRGPIGSATINLDRAKPSVTYTERYDEPTSRLTFILEKSVPEFVVVKAKSTRDFVTWEASLLLSVDGVRRRISLKDPDTHGPFRVTPGKGFKSFDWDGTKWTLVG
jgi:hypothetical protein